MCNVYHLGFSIHLGLFLVLGIIVMIGKYVWNLPDENL